jgi:predicted nucleotidyltransferase
MRMFTAEERDRVRQYVLDLAKDDPRVTAGALTGSAAVDAEDEWSDIDVAFGIKEGTGLGELLDDWTEQFKRDLDLIHHWDVSAGPSIYRVFLLPGGLEIDIGVSPEREFGARGPRFRALFGTPVHIEASAPPDRSQIVGLGWHHIFHARSSIERGTPWKAEHWLSAVREQTFALACLRLGEESFHARGIDRLPDDVKRPLEETLIGSLDPTEMRRALAAATTCFLREVEMVEPALCAKLRPLLETAGRGEVVRGPQEPASTRA